VSNHFPNDENGDVLRRMWEGGDKLTQARDIDFTVVFPNHSAAEEFAEHLRQAGHKTSVTESKCVPELPWDVLVTTHTQPSHFGITEFEETLEAMATPLGGRNDGWCCVRLQTPN
jgi:hypothetical protein